MSEQFYTIPTATGKAKIANSIVLGTKINLTTMKVGDSNGSYYDPSESQTDLVHTVYSCNVTSVEIDETNSNWINVICAIPSDVGDFYIREAGIFDYGGNLIAIGKYPETYKPVAADGSTKELYIKMTFQVTNASSVELKIDPTVILATKSDISILTNSIAQINSSLSEIVQRATDLSINVKGLGFLAKGDGSTDDTTAVQNALSALVANGGGELFFPKGIYCSNAFTVPTNVIIRGAGQNVTFLKLNDNQNTDFIIFDNSAYSGITNLTVNGNKSNNTSGNSLVIKSSASTDASNIDLKIEHIQIQNAKENGLKCISPNSWVFQIRFIHIENCDGYGFYNTATDNSFYAIDIYGCKLGAVYSGGANNRFIGGKWYVNGDSTLATSSNTLYCKGRRNQYIGIEIQESYGNGIVIENATDEQFSNILIDATGYYNVVNQQTALKFIGASRCKFEGIISNGDVTDSTKFQYQGVLVDDNSTYIDINAEIDEDRIVTPISIDKAKNVHINGNIMNIPFIKLYNAGSQTFTSAVYTTLKLSQSSDINRMTYNSTTGEITVLGNGVYNLNIDIAFDTATTTPVSLYVYKNGNLSEKLYYNSISQSYILNANLIMKLNTNDIIRIDINPISSNVTINNNNTSHVYLTQIK